MRELAVRAEELMKELDKIEAAERNLNIRPEVYTISVRRGGVDYKFNFSNQDDMMRFINTIGREE